MISKLKSQLFKGLAHPIRIEIIELLKDQELCVCTIYEELEQSQSNISQHLNKLKSYQILESRKDGLKVFYRLKDKKILKILDLAKSIIVKQIQVARESLLKENKDD
ncbi:ArsR/SmtB family transcription factor [Natronospora cellulosivora (SeqCode)]